MKLNFAWVAIFLLNYLNGYAQQISIKKTVYNSRDKSAIPYATIKVIGTNNITDCDRNGHFEISAKNTDSLLFSCVGFTTLKVSVNQIIDRDSLFLKEFFSELETVQVKNSPPLSLGIIYEKQQRSHIGSSSLVPNRYEMATLIKIPASIKIFRINKVFIKQKYFNSYAPFQLHIYSINDQGLPDSELLKSPIIVTNKNSNNHKDMIEIDIKAQNIVLEGVSFFIGIQWMTSEKEMEPIKKDYGIGETFKLSDMLTYRRSLTSEKYRWFIEFEKCLVFPKTENDPEIILFWDKNKTKNYGNPINMLASAEIVEL